MGQANLSTKRKPSERVDRPPKKPKVVTGSIVGETSATSKLPFNPSPGKGKGMTKGANPVTEKCPVLFREGSGYALKQLSSIIKDNDYEDLCNHATEAIGEMGLFSLVQVCFLVLFPLFHPIVVSF